MPPSFSTEDGDLGKKIVELHTAICGIEGRGGLIEEVDKMNLALFGNGKDPGMCSVVITHTAWHKKWDKRVLAILGGLAIIVVTEFVHFIFGWL